MNKFKYLLQECIKNILEDIDKINFDSTDNYNKGQFFTYYEILQNITIQAFFSKIPLKELGLDKYDYKKLLHIDINSNIYQVVKRIINEWDPYDLISCGAPDDEYENEIKVICFKIEGKNSIKDVAHVIFDVFTKAFGDDITCFSIENCMDIAKKIKNCIE
jgi:hypothetical protein